MNIKEAIFSEMPDGLDDLGKARYIYLRLADYLNFSTKFINTSEEEFARMYNTRVNSFNLESNQVTCNIWSGIYSSLLNELNIKNQVINQVHKFVVFEYKNKLWVADATGGAPSDLSKIKNGQDTDYFGVAQFQNYENTGPYINIYDSDNELVNEIDSNFDFYQERKNKYKLLTLSITRIRNSNLSLSKKMELFFNTLGKLNNGYYESKDFVHMLTFDFLSADEKLRVKGVELKRTNKDLEVDILQCIYVLNEDSIDYYLLAPNLQIKKVDAATITRLSMLGYGIEKREIPGVVFVKNFKKGVVSHKGLKYHLFKNRMPELSVYDKPQISVK